MSRYFLTAAVAMFGASLLFVDPAAPADEQAAKELKTKAELQATQLADLRRRHARAIHALAEAELAAAIEQNRLSPGTVRLAAVRRMSAIVQASRISAQMAELMTHPLEVEKVAFRMALEQKVSVDFRQATLTELIETLADKYRINFVFDERALADAGLDPEQIEDVTIILRSVPLRSLLNLVLREYDLTFLAEEGVVTITTRDEANQRLSTVVYDVYDLLIWDQIEKAAPPGDLDYDSLIQMITGTVAPTTWDEVGGPGSIAALYGSLVVSQTEEVHNQLADLLLRLRKMRLSRSDVSGVVRVLEAGQ